MLHQPSKLILGDFIFASRLLNDLAMKNRWCLLIISLCLCTLRDFFFNIHIWRDFEQYRCQTTTAPIQTLHMWMHLRIICVCELLGPVAFFFFFLDQTSHHDKNHLWCSVTRCHIIPSRENGTLWPRLTWCDAEWVFRGFAADLDDCIYMLIAAGHVHPLWSRNSFFFISSVAIQSQTLAFLFCIELNFTLSECILLFVNK